MDPDLNPQNNPAPPMFNAPYQSPQPVIDPNQNLQHNSSGNKSKSKFLLMLAAISALELLVIIGLAIAVISTSDKKSAPVQTGSDKTSQSEGPSAATSSRIQLIDDAVSQSLSSLNDDQDFPGDKLSDKNLGL